MFISFKRSCCGGDNIEEKNKEILIKFGIPLLVLFLPIQVMVITFFEVQSIPTLVFIDTLMVVYFVIWISKAEISYKDNRAFGKLTLPVLYLFISMIVATFLSLLGGHGIIWTVSWLLLGSVPLMIALIYIIYSLAKHRKFDLKFFNTQYKKYANTLEKSWGISIVIAFLIIFSPVIINYSTYLLIDNDTEIRNIVNDLIDESMNDTAKTIALLDWFDRGVGKEENMANKYYRIREGQSDIDILLSFWLGDICIFSKAPYFCTRFHSDDPNIIFASRYGQCGEYSSLFNTMGYYAGLDIRRAVCKGEDHLWNEVNIGGEWIIVDPTAVNLDEYTGFKDSNFMEKKVRGEFEVSNRPDEGNVSYVYAEYLDGRPNEDITYRYSNTVNITIRTVDNNNQSIPNVTIKVYSLNSAKTSNHDRVILEKTTNETGHYTFTLGDGNYRFSVEKGDLKGIRTYEFSRYNLTYDRTIELC